MFDFIKELDSLLYKDFDDINKNIQLQTNIVETALQIYVERLMKVVNQKEKIINKPKLKLGELINNDNFNSCLIKKYKLSEDMILNLKVISNKSNDHKHEERSEFIKKEIKKWYRLIIYTTIKIYNIFFYKNYELNGKSIDDYFDTLLEENKELENKIRTQILNAYENENKDKEQQIKEANRKIKIQEQSLEKALKDLENYNEAKEKIIDLELENAKSNNLIDSLREQVAILELNNDNAEKILDEKEELIRQLEEKENIIAENNKMIDELSKQCTINPTVEVDRCNKIIFEQSERIRILENSEFLNKQVKNTELLEEQRRLDRRLCFHTSYVLDDNPFLLRNISYKNYSTSKYKQFYAVVNNFLQRGECINLSPYLNSIPQLTKEDLKEIIRLEIMILNLIKDDRIKDNIWRINYIEGNIENIKIAINDIVYYIEKLTSMAKIEFVMPNLILTNDSYIDDGLTCNIVYNSNCDEHRYLFKIEDFEYYDVEETSDNIGELNYWIEDSIEYKIDNNNLNDLSYFLKTFFQFDNFRAGQFEIIKHTLSQKNTIGILPTGSGKSVIYQLSALLQPKITIVIAPTKELIKDQIRVLKERFKITKCTKITGDKDVNKVKELDNLGKLKNIFTFISPERLQSSEFRSRLLYLINEYNAFDKIVLDEVHCLSEWGHDFRIAYLMVAHTLKQYCPNVKFLGLTATASKSVVKDLMIELNIKNRYDVIYNETYKRENLIFEFDYFNDEDELDETLVEDLFNLNVTLNGDKTNSALIFAKTKPDVEEIYNYLSDEVLFGNKVGYFYSKDNDNEDEIISTDAFMNNEQSILVSTKAFGMGIDKPNIRATFHYGIPSSLESFYQEAGRAGREIGSTAICRIMARKYGYKEQKLIDEFFSPGTKIDRLKEIANNWDLYNSRVDVRTNFYFLTKDLDEPNKEARDTIKFYQDMYSRIGKDNIYKIVVPKYYYDPEAKGKKKYKENKPKIEKYLYILHKCGVVDNWEVSYLINELEFKILFDSEYKNIEYIKTKTINYIEQYPAENKQVLSIINAVTDYSELINIISAMRNWYYNNFIMTRRNQLANIYKYATEDFCNRKCSNEIQDKIDSYFSIADLLKNIENNLSYGFDNQSFKYVIEKCSKITESNIEREISKIESELESVENNKMKIYISILNLRKNNFETRNGREQFEYVLNNAELEEKIEIYESINKHLINILLPDQKEEILDIMFNSEPNIFKKVFINDYQNSVISKKYWIPFINEKIVKLFGGENK